MVNLQGPIGPGAAGRLTIQQWDIYQRKAFCLASAADLAGTTLTLFDGGLSSSYLPIGGTVGTTPMVTMGNSDTNLDTPGQVPFDNFLIEGLALQVLNTQLTQGIVGTSGATVNQGDLAFWPAIVNSILADSYCTFEINDTKYLRCLAIDIPAAGGLSGFASQGTSAALTVGASIQGVSNGMPLVNNFLSLGQNKWSLLKSDRIKFSLTFGPGMINQSSAQSKYQPAIGSPQPTFIRVVLKGRRADQG